MIIQFLIGLIVVLAVAGILYLKNQLKTKKMLISEIQQLTDKVKSRENVIRELNESNRMLDEYIKTIQQDIRKPFSSILCLTNILIEDFDFLPNEDKLHHIKEIKDATDRSFNYLENLFVWINHQNGFNELKVEKVDIAKTINENIEKVFPEAYRKQITIETDLDPKLIAHTNPEVVNTVVRNLLHNALKYTNNAGLIFISAFNTADMIKLVIEDNGPGIPVPAQKTIYDNWEKGNTIERDRDFEKSMGLTLSKELLNRVHGEIWFETRENVGSKFTVTIPR